MSDHDERLWASLAHASYLLNFVTGLLGVAAPLVIYVLYKDRSRFVAYHAMQSFIFQLVWWVGGGFLTGVAWATTGLLSPVLIGLLCIPFALAFSLIPLAGAVYAGYAAIKVYNGDDFRYWLVSDWVNLDAPSPAEYPNEGE